MYIVHTVGETQNQNCAVMLLLLSHYTDVVYIHNLFPFGFQCSMGLLISPNKKPSSKTYSMLSNKFKLITTNLL